MTKWLSLFALAGGLLACAEPRSVETDEQPGFEASPQQAEHERDLMLQFGGGGKITNLSAKCEANSDCKGSAAMCLKSVPLVNTTIEGGACTANCTRDTECGTNAGCPLAQIANLAKTFLPDAGAAAGSLAVCLPKCKTDADCRSDMPCQTIPIPSIPLLLTAPTSKFCLPPLPKQVDGGILLPDGGILTIPDGGFRLPDGGALPTIPGLGGLGGFGN